MKFHENTDQTLLDKTNDMIKDEGLWAGLNRPTIATKEADATIFGLPFDGGASFRAGAAMGPSSLREISYTITPTTESFESFETMKIKDLGDFNMADFDAIHTCVAELVKENSFFVMIGGDHSTTIPVLQGINKGFEGSLGILHLDAHFDLCDHMDENKLAHGCTQRRALELECVSGVESIYFLGLRSIEMDELDFYKKNLVNVFSSKEIHKQGVESVMKKVLEHMKQFDAVYITVDIDVLDPAFAAGTGTPQFGGLYSRQVLDIMESLFTLNVIGMDIVEVAPPLDGALTSVFAARKILTESLGHLWKKRTPSY